MLTPNDDLVLSVSDFVALLNQTLEYAYPSVSIIGELANFRVSKNQWVYFDLKDESASLKFFGSIHQLPGPLEDGLIMQVRGVPRVHPQYGFSVNVQFMSPVGKGSLKRAATLLEAKLTAEGLFDPARKRSIPYPPASIGLITSQESAAYHDFIKILDERWGGVDITLADVQVQGEAAPTQIINAIDYFNTHTQPVDVLVITRGGGSAEDLAAFSTEQVTRAVAGSRIPTLVAIGHEFDVSLTELAADQRASTPSNAAELLVPDKKQIIEYLKSLRRLFYQSVLKRLSEEAQGHQQIKHTITESWLRLIRYATESLKLKQQLLDVLNPEAVLKRGFAVVHQFDGDLIRSIHQLSPGDQVRLRFSDGNAESTIKKVI
ncbi:exodeoxyribonuclease VII large subunit [Candidatus Saccharibacteria bacterium]|nr:exodeoxyribonuclease VII large subunit [Candidatus Saccharibacteria bacterium]